MEKTSFCLAVNRYKTLREVNPWDLFRRLLQPPGTFLSEKEEDFLLHSEAKDLGHS